MIRQNETNWAKDDTPRQWMAHPSGDVMVCRRYPQAGCEIDGDYPPTVELSADEWHALTETIDMTDPRAPIEISRRLDALVWP